MNRQNCIHLYEMAELCGTCKAECINMADCLTCDGPCRRIFHGDCVNITKKARFEVKKFKNIMWNCDDCLAYTVNNTKAIAELFEKPSSASVIQGTRSYNNIDDLIDKIGITEERVAKIFVRKSNIQYLLVLHYLRRYLLLFLFFFFFK